MPFDSRALIYLNGLLLATALGSLGCGGSKTSGAASGGMGGSGSGTGGSPGAVGASALPVPPGAGNVPRPSGAAGNLKVLDWAGFKSALTYTFDDAQPSQVEHYSELTAAGVRMTFFITSANVLGNADVNATFTQAVADGHEMGNHTVHHCHADLSGCSTGAGASLEIELNGCTNYITEHLGQPQVWTAASPYGDTGYDSPDAERFFLNRGVSGGTIAPNDATDPFNLPCHAAVEAETVDSFNRVIDTTNSAGRWVIMLIHTLSPTAASWYAPIDISVVTGSIGHAQSLGEVWVDSMVNVGAYWRAQKVLSSATPAASGDSQTWSWTVPEHFPPGKYLRVTVDGGTLSQGGSDLAWDSHGYYEVSLDAGSLTLAP